MRDLRAGYVVRGATGRQKTAAELHVSTEGSGANPRPEPLLETKLPQQGTRNRCVDSDQVKGFRRTPRRRLAFAEIATGVRWRSVAEPLLARPDREQRIDGSDEVRSVRMMRERPQIRVDPAQSGH